MIFGSMSTACRQPAGPMRRTTAMLWRPLPGPTPSTVMPDSMPCRIAVASGEGILVSAMLQMRTLRLPHARQQPVAHLPAICVISLQLTPERSVLECSAQYDQRDHRGAHRQAPP